MKIVLTIILLLSVIQAQSICNLSDNFRINSIEKNGGTWKCIDGYIKHEYINKKIVSTCSGKYPLFCCSGCSLDQIADTNEIQKYYNEDQRVQREEWERKKQERKEREEKERQVREEQERQERERQEREEREIIERVEREEQERLKREHIQKYGIDCTDKKVYKDSNGKEYGCPQGTFNFYRQEQNGQEIVLCDGYEVGGRCSSNDSDDGTSIDTSSNKNETKDSSLMVFQVLALLVLSLALV